MSILSRTSSFSLFAGLVFTALANTSAAAESGSNLVKGEILSIDLASNTAVISPKRGGEAFTVRFPANVRVSGLHGNANASDLKKGHLVTLKMASR